MDKSYLIGALVLIILLAVFIPTIQQSISNASNVYECLNPLYQVDSRDGTLCTNASYVCTNGALPVLTGLLCTNASGVGVVNASATSGFSVYNESATYEGITPVESTLLTLVPLFLILGAIIFIAYDFIKNKN